ncbi:glycosyl hydrolase 108 family protein [Hypericibacter sp.]|uniref:glycosyl hydrolase 108 family protein n=1 Tax=Hypericibacter sp. TaxID=2705401 RepID=UPI003D6C7EB2
MSPRGTPSLRFTVDGPRQLADQIAEQLRKEASEQIAQIPETEHSAASGRSAAAPAEVIYGPDGTPRWRPRVEDFLDVIMPHEGGFVDNPKDRGRRTNFGITQETLDGWFANQRERFDKRQQRRDPALRKEFEPKRLPSVPGIPTDVKDLTLEQARALHKDLNWDTYKLDQIKDDGTALQFLDMRFMTSPYGMKKIIYPAIDDVMKKHDLGEMPYATLPNGPSTNYFGPAIDLVNWLDALGFSRELQEALVNRRLAYVKTLPRYKYFHNGWDTRIESFRPKNYAAR